MQYSYTENISMVQGRGSTEQRYTAAPLVCVSVNMCCSQTDLVAFLCLVVPVGVREMDVAARLLHHPLDVVATFANNVGVLCVGHVHLQSYPVTLTSREEKVRVRWWLISLMVSGAWCFEKGASCYACIQKGFKNKQYWPKKAEY